MQRGGIVRPVAQGLHQEPLGRGFEPRIRQLFDGQLLVEDGVHRLVRAERGQEFQQAGAGAIAQIAGLAQQQVRVLREFFQQGIDTAGAFFAVAVICRQSPSGLPGEQMVVRAGGEGVEFFHGRGPVVPDQRQLELMIQIIPRFFRQRDGLQTRRFGLWCHHEAARAIGRVMFQKWFCHGFAQVGIVGVAQQERAAQRIVTHHGLQVRVRRVHGGQGEGQPGIQQLGGGFPRQRELFYEPPVLFRPFALAISRRTVVAHRCHQLQMIGGRLPVTAEGGERGRGTSPVILPHKAHRQLDPACGQFRVGQPVGEPFVEIVIKRARQSQCFVTVAAQVGQPAALRAQPFV